MVGQAMAKSDLIKKAARMRTDKRSQPQIKNGDILLTEIGMLTLDKTDFDYVNEFHKDEEYYKMSLGIAYGIFALFHQLLKYPVTLNICKEQ